MALTTTRKAYCWLVMSWFSGQLLF